MSVQGFVITQADMLSHTKPVYYMREKGGKKTEHFLIEVPAWLSPCSDSWLYMWW